jgi:hypothetical protein
MDTINNKEKNMNITQPDYPQYLTLVQYTTRLINELHELEGVLAKYDLLNQKDIIISIDEVITDILTLKNKINANRPD